MPPEAIEAEGIAPGYILSSCASSRFQSHDSTPPSTNRRAVLHAARYLFLCFSAMFEFGGDYSLAEYAAHFQSGSNSPLDERRATLCSPSSPDPHTRRLKWLRLTLPLCHGLRSNLGTRNRTDILPLEAFALPAKSRRKDWRWTSRRFGRSLYLKATAECMPVKLLAMVSRPN